MPRAPLVASYRLQLHRGFRFEDARQVVAYLRDLGVSHVYLSPIASARPGSPHGYDTIDPGRINPELGTAADFAALVRELRAARMGVLLDLVPNHVAADPRNPWWRDLLVHGRRSRHAKYFDVDWDANDGKLLLPVLDRPFADALAAGDIRLVRGSVRYLDQRWPLARATWAAAARARSPEAIAAVLAAQHYRLGHWRSGNERISHRRFFDVGDLAGVRVEDEEVFEAMHALLFALARRGALDGVRVDHLDGLRDPIGYLARLRERLAEETGDPRFWTVVEKILVGPERLPRELAADGDSGYAFLNALNATFVDAAGLRTLDALYARLGSSTTSFARVEHQEKLRALLRLFPAETRRLADRLAAFATQDPLAFDLSPVSLWRALCEVTAAMPVYRTYLRGGRMARGDAAVLAAALHAAEARIAAEDRPAVRFLGRVLRLETGAPRRDEWQDWVLRWQQLTGPVMAKGVEDTALYVYGRLFSLNEVGGQPDAEGDALRRFHAFCRERRVRLPRALSATSTHDTKRSEDVRARIHVLSEVAGEWERLVRTWDVDTPMSELADASERALLLQTLLGAYPVDRADLPAFEARIRAYLVKAAREAKQRTSWRHPNEAHEHALAELASAFLRLPPRASLRRAFTRLLRRVAFHGAINALGQVVLKVAAPGVPDFYQGTELWSLRLVDPDNRVPIDFAQRASLLRELGPDVDLGDVRRRWRNGRIKLLVTARALAARRADPALYLRGEYIPLRVEGAHAESVIAFARRRRDRWALAIAARLTTRLVDRERWPIGPVWGTTTLRLPRGAPARWEDVLGRVEVASGRTLRVSHALRNLPVALLRSH